MGAQDGKKVWFETASFWQLLKYFFKFALTIFIIAFIFTYVLTRFFNWDILLLQFHMQNLWLLIPESLVVIGSLGLWIWSRKTEHRKPLEVNRTNER
jgi:ABC-type antimicrobial peptide transport system permease subunit